MSGITLRQAEAPYLLPPEFDADMQLCLGCSGDGCVTANLYGTDIEVKCDECAGMGEVEASDSPAGIFADSDVPD